MLTALALVGLVGGLSWELRHPEPFINLRLMRDRSFLVGCMIISSTYAVLYGSILLLPQMMQGLMGYDATNAGLVLSPAGLFSMITMIASALILRLRVDARWLIAAGRRGHGRSARTWLVTLNLQAGPLQIVWPRVVQMAGAGLMFAPLAAAARPVPAEDRDEQRQRPVQHAPQRGLERGHRPVDRRAPAPACSSTRSASPRASSP